MKRLLIFFLFSYANVAFLNAESILPDSSTVNVRSYTEEGIEKFRSQKEYNYDLDPKYEQNPIKKLWYSFMRRIMDRMGQGTVNILWAVIKYGLILLGLFFLGRFLIRSQKTSMWKRSDKSPDYIGALVKSEAGGENIKKIISEAEQESDYKKAVRYRFLLLLRDMDRKELIEWTDYKSNYDYASEINDSKLRSDFSHLSEIFDYVVYGNFEMEKGDYEPIKVEFMNFFSNAKSLSV